MAIRINHDGLFKEITKDNFPEFVEACFHVDPEDIEYFQFLDKESHKSTLLIGDLLVEVKFAFEDEPILIHIEFKAQREPGYIRQAFKYFCRFHEEYNQRVLSAVVYSHDVNVKEVDQYDVNVLDYHVLDFHIVVIQLNQKYWRDYIDKPNPIHAAFMTRMRCPEEEKVELKLEFYKMLEKLDLSEARYEKLVIFMETYLILTKEQQESFEEQIKHEIPEKEVKKMVEMMTSYERRGREEGRQEGKEVGREEEKREIAQKMLKKNFPIESICEITTLSREQVLSIA